MTSRWSGYFERYFQQYSSPAAYASEHWTYHMPLYSRIKAHLPAPARVLEVGCGPGFSSIYLASWGYQVTAIDNDPEVVQLAREITRYFDLDLRVEIGDARDLSGYYSKYDLVFSKGLLEHFDYDETVRLLIEQSRCAANVLLVVPSAFTRFAAPITDERLYSIGDIRGMFRKAGLTVTKSFGYGDITATRMHRFIKRILPFDLYVVLQNHFSYAMQLGCLGRTR